MAIAKRIAYNVVLNSSLKVISTVVLSLLSIRLITEYLGPEGFGKYATILAFFAFFSAIIDLGLGPVTAREISRQGANEKQILGNILALRLLSSTALFVVSPLIIVLFAYPNDLKIGLLFASGATLFSTLSLVLNGVFQKRLSMDKVAMVEFLGKLVQVGLVILVVQNDWGFLAVASTFLASLIFNAIVVFLLSRRYISFPLRFDFAYWKTFLKESLPMGATAIITFAYFKMDTILLSMMQSNTDVGIYNVAYKIMENLIFFPAMLAGLILPLLSRFIYTDRPQFNDIADKTFAVFIIIVTPLIMGTWFLAPQIISIVSGGGFEQSASVLRILVFALGCIFFGHYFNMLLVVSNAQKKLMQTLIVAAVFNIVLNLFLIPRYSYMGAAFTSVATELLVILLTGTLVFRHIGYLPSLRRVGRILLAGVLMGASLLLLSRASFLLAGAASVLVYVVSLWITRAVTYAEMKSLFSGKGEASPQPLDTLLS
ncbi:MAG: flippase [Patescibacteria group bacterium]